MNIPHRILIPTLIDIVYLRKNYLPNILRCLFDSHFLNPCQFPFSVSNTLLQFSLFLSLLLSPQSIFTWHSSLNEVNNWNNFHHSINWFHRISTFLISGMFTHLVSIHKIIASYVMFQNRLRGTNTLAYFASATMTRKISFKILTPGGTPWFSAGCPPPVHWTNLEKNVNHSLKMMKLII